MSIDVIFYMYIKCMLLQSKYFMITTFLIANLLGTSIKEHWAALLFLAKPLFLI